MRAFGRAHFRSAAAGCEHESGSPDTSGPQSKVESRFKSIAILEEEALLTIVDESQPAEHAL